MNVGGRPGPDEVEAVFAALVEGRVSRDEADRCPQSREWPTDKLTALRLGQRLVAEVPASGAGRRAFVDITPLRNAADLEARRQSWTRADHARVFRIRHRDYDAKRLAGFDYDIEEILVREATAAGESELAATLDAWWLRPDQFRYPSDTDDPR